MLNAYEFKKKARNNDIKEDKTEKPKQTPSLNFIPAEFAPFGVFFSDGFEESFYGDVNRAAM